MREIIVDPLTRIEGHLAVRALVDEEEVKDAWAHATMFRGFEIILVGRDPIDAQFITSRICGVCSIDHGIAAARALECALKIKPTPMGTVLRNLIQGAHWIYDHIIHCFLLAGPDYGPPFGKIGELEALKGEGYIQALKMQRLAMEATAIFAGKVPHGASIIPGGVTETPDLRKVTAFMYRLRLLKKWVDEYMIPLFDKFYEIYSGELSSSGEREANLIAYGTFEDPSLDPMKRWLKPGVIVNGSLVTADLYGEIEANIYEDVVHSWYTDDSGGKPSEEAPPKPLFTGLDKNGKYSYAKAPRWKGLVMEAGPLARMWSTALQSGGKVVTDAGEWKPPKKPNTVERIYARAYETAFVAKKMVEELDKLFDLLKAGEKATWREWSIPDTSSGKGLVEAARGALGHWITIKGGKIERYQVITPTAWNISPRDSKGKRGAVEEALVGTKITSKSEPSLDVVRVVRAFDPCLACTVHVFRG